MLVTQSPLSPVAPLPSLGAKGWLSRAEGEVARNQVLSRVAIELFFVPCRMACARNKFERFEALMDTVVWWIMGMGLPLLVQWPLSKWYTRSILKPLSLAHKTPLNMPLEKLQAGFLKSAGNRMALCKELGLTQAKKLPRIVNLLILGKLAMVFVDLACMSAKNQVYFWGRNALTAALSKKKGFSGEFTIATAAQLAQNAKERAATEKQRRLLSMINGLTYPLTLPLILLGLLKAPQSAKGSVLGKLKRLLPHFNYHNTIYMSKWVVFWNCLFGWNLTGLLSARDWHEKREHLMRCAVVDFFFFIGDDIFAGIAGKVLQNRYKKQLQGIKLYKPGWFGIPLGRELDHVIEDAGKSGRKSIAVIAEKLGRWNFRIGILTTSIFLGLGFSLINNWITKQKVLQEQATVKRKTQSNKALSFQLPASYNRQTQ